MGSRPEAVNPADEILRALPGPGQQARLAALVALGTPGLERLLAVISERAPLYVNSPYDFRVPPARAPFFPVGAASGILRA